MVNKTAMRNLAIATVIALGVSGVLWAQSKEPSKDPAEAAETVLKASGANHDQAKNHQAFHEQTAKNAAVIIHKAEQDVEGQKYLLQQHRVDEHMQIHGDWARQQLERAGVIVDGVMKSAGQYSPTQQEFPEEQIRRSDYVVYVSQSMGTEGLKQIFEYGRGRPDVVYVFRGFRPGQTMDEFIQYIQQFQGKTESEIVNISLDPPSFQDNSIEVVPAIVHYDASEKVTAKVTGLANYQWLKDRVERGERGDMGRRGEGAYQIVEEDLVEVMKQRAAQMDLSSEAEKAFNNYFQSLAFAELPYADEQRIRKVAPILQVGQDVVDHQGIIRYRKGEIVDMQDELVNAPVLIIFNSQDEAHREFAKIMGDRADPQRQVIYMTTHVDRDGGIPGYVQQEYEFGRPIFLLMDDVKNTFGIERIPTVVTPTDKEFVVVEVPLKHWRKE